MAHPSRASMPTQLLRKSPWHPGFLSGLPLVHPQAPRPADFLPTSWQWGLQGPEPSGAKPHQHSNVALLPKQGVVREYGDRVLMSRLGRVPSREHGSPPPAGRRPIWLPWHRWKGPRWLGCCPSPPAETHSQVTCPGTRYRRCVREALCTGTRSPVAQDQPTHVTLSRNMPTWPVPARTHRAPSVPLGSLGRDLPALGASPHGAVGEGALALSHLLGQEAGQRREVHP